MIERYYNVRYIYEGKSIAMHASLKHCLLCVFLICFMWSFEAEAEELREMTLSQAIETAQKDASTWTQFDARAEMAQAKYKEVESHWWPIVSIDSSLMFWTDVAELEVIDKEEIQTNLTNSLAEASQQMNPAMQAIFQQMMPAVQTICTHKKPLSFFVTGLLTRTESSVAKTINARVTKIIISVFFCCSL